jgi:hypothetical protein
MNTRQRYLLCVILTTIVVIGATIIQAGNIPISNLIIAWAANIALWGLYIFPIRKK